MLNHTLPSVFPREYDESCGATKPLRRGNCRYFVQLSYSSFTIRTGRTLVLARAIDWHIALTQAGPKCSRTNFSAFKQNFSINIFQHVEFNANFFVLPVSQCSFEMLFFFNRFHLSGDMLQDFSSDSYSRRRWQQPLLVCEREAQLP